MGWVTKWIKVPASNAIKDIESIQLWEVRWSSKKHRCDYDGTPEIEAFPTEAEAVEYAEALSNAFKLLRYKCFTEVTIKRAR